MVQAKEHENATDNQSAPAAGDVMQSVELGLCAGGLVRTWLGADLAESRLWSVPDGELIFLMYHGQLARTAVFDEVPARAMREIAFLIEDKGLLIAMARMVLPKDTDSDSEGRTTNNATISNPSATIQLRNSQPPTGSVESDLLYALKTAILYVVEQGLFLIVEPGGAPKPGRPFCRFPGK